MVKLALLLEIIGFFITGILVAVIQWEKVKPFSDRIKTIIVESPTRLGTLFSRIIKTLSYPIRVRGANFPEKPKIWQFPRLITEAEIYLFILTPLLVILILVMIAFLFIVQLTAKLLSGHMVITNMLLAIGVLLVLAGLILELILNW